MDETWTEVLRLAEEGKNLEVSPEARARAEGWAADFKRKQREADAKKTLPDISHERLERLAMYCERVPLGHFEALFEYAAHAATPRPCSDVALRAQIRAAAGQRGLALRGPAQPRRQGRRAATAQPPPSGVAMLQLLFRSAAVRCDSIVIPDSNQDALHHSDRRHYRRRAFSTPRSRVLSFRAPHRTPAHMHTTRHVCSPSQTQGESWAPAAILRRRPDWRWQGRRGRSRTSPACCCVYATSRCACSHAFCCTRMLSWKASIHSSLGNCPFQASGHTSLGIVETISLTIFQPLFLFTSVKAALMF